MNLFKKIIKCLLVPINNILYLYIYQTFGFESGLSITLNCESLSN